MNAGNHDRARPAQATSRTMFAHPLTETQTRYSGRLAE